MSTNYNFERTFILRTMSRHINYALAFLVLFCLSIVTPYAANRVRLKDTAAQKETYYRYRVSLRDKQLTHYSIECPEVYLSAKSIARRERFDLPVDSTDLPVCQEYKKQIRALGFPIVLESKWQNTVVIAVTDTSALVGLRQLPFVSKIRRVFSSANTSGEATNSLEESSLYKRQTLIKTVQSTRDVSYYGYAHEQTKMTKRDTLNALGYTGRGISVAVIDAGFQNVDSLPAFKHLDVAGTRNFNRTSISSLKNGALPDDHVYDKSEHGTKVLSCMASDSPHKIVGTAYDATYYLIRSEDEMTESLYEMDTYAAALEYADSVGVQLINSSLGYFSFDDSRDNLRLRDLDGESTFISRQASMVASKGMLLVCSAGNSGDDAWKKITPPADAKNVLVVGAVRKDSLLAAFSSVGCTVDGRIVPSVVTQGEDLAVLSSSGWVTHASGTSFAAPQIAAALTCMMQAYPDISPTQWIALVEHCSNLSEFPNNIYGYGIPNFKKLYILLQKHKVSSILHD